MAPSKKRIVRVCKKISTITDRRRSGLDPTKVVAELNRVLRGWAGYFCLGPVSDTYRAINSHVRYRFRKWWGAKHKKARFGPCWYWSPWLEQTYGLLQLRWDPSRLPHAKARTFSESRMREIRKSGSMSGTWKRSTDRLVRHRQTKGPETDRPLLNHRATSRLYQR